MAASIARLATASGVAALDGLLNETLRLAAEARGYVVTGDPSVHRPEAIPLAQLVEACELSRLAARLGFCISWLLASRAVHQGRLGPQDPDRAKWRLEGSEVCLESGADDPGVVPDNLRDMLDRSLALYRRVARLDRRLDA